VILRDLRELIRHRDLLWTWIVREIQVRYKQSLLGAGWAILQPLSLMVVFTAVFSFLARIPTGDIPYPVFSYTGVLPWTFFATAVTFGVSSLTNNSSLVTKTYFPREILPLGAIGASFLDYLIASSIFVALLIFYHVQLTTMVLWLPVVLLPQILLTMGITFLGAALTVFYRDVRFIVPLVLQVWFFATPVIYPVTLVPQSLRPIYMLNPMAGFVQSYRRILLEGLPPVGGNLALSAAVALAVFLIGYRVFKQLEDSFADVI
jgi:lipopolysaccharide transport system permease protein